MSFNMNAPVIYDDLEAFNSSSDTPGHPHRKEPYTPLAEYDSFSA